MQIILWAFYIFYLSLVVPPGQYFVYFLGICRCFFLWHMNSECVNPCSLCDQHHQRRPHIDPRHATSTGGGAKRGRGDGGRQVRGENEAERAGEGEGTRCAPPSPPLLF